MIKKYLVIADYVYSTTDRNRHYISGHTLMQLYNVNPQECVLYPADVGVGARMEPSLKGLIHLRPQKDGNYTLDT